MKSRVLHFLLVFLPTLGWAQLKPMSVSEVQSFQQTLQQLIEVKTLEADFVQYKYVSFMKKPVESKGKLYLKDSHLLRWSYVSPFVYDMILKDNKIYINDQGNRRTVNFGNNKQFEKISALVRSSLRGGNYDEKEFAVSYFKKDGANLVRLTPKLNEAKKYITNVELLFSDVDKHIQEIILTEPSKDYTRFILSNKKINKQINDSVFNL